MLGCMIVHHNEIQVQVQVIRFSYEWTICVTTRCLNVV